MHTKNEVRTHMPRKISGLQVGLNPLTKAAPDTNTHSFCLSFSKILNLLFSQVGNLSHVYSNQATVVELSSYQHIANRGPRQMRHYTIQCFLWCCLVGLCSIPMPVLANTTFKVIHTPKPNAEQGRPYEILCQIPENEELDEVFVRFRQQGAKAYRAIRMRLFQGDRYRLILAGTLVRLPGFEYYITALDADKKRHVLFSTAQKPYRVKVSKQVEVVENKKEDNKLDVSEESGRVISATRREQRIQNAPAVITVLTASDIKAGGWRSLTDLLRFVVGFDVNDNGHSPDLGIRGLNPSQSFGDKMIILIDGHNMVWRQFNRNLINQSWVSIDNIKRIEIIRGPGSALWGANALSGVVNIITKTGQNLTGFQGIVGGSPLGNSYFLTLQGGQEIVGGLTFRGSFSIFQDSRSAVLSPIYEFTKGQNPVNYIVPGVKSFSQNFYGQLSWKGFNLRFLQSRYLPTASISNSNLFAGSSSVGSEHSQLSTNRYILRMSWSQLLGAWGSFTAWGSYDNYGYAQGNQLEVNGLSRFTSNARLKGNSQNFAIYEKKTGDTLGLKGYYPACSELPPGSKTPCVRLTTGSRSEQVCSLLQNPSQDPQSGTKYSYSAFVPKACRNSFRNGNFVIRQDATDHRLEAGLLFNALMLDGALSLSSGVEVEYLIARGYHIPEFLEMSGKEAPNFSNFHGSAFLQLQYNFLNVLGFTGSIRADYDQIYGFIATPRAAVVWTPGLGFYAKLLYGNAFKAPSIQDRFFFVDRNAVLFGNPVLEPESVNTFEVQVGWSRRRLIALSASGYLSFFQNLITTVVRNTADPFLGEDKYPKEQWPARTEDFRQKDNTSQITTYGGEIELRIFPSARFNILGSFGVFFGQDDKGAPLEHIAPWKATLVASYQIPLRSFDILLSAGGFIAGSKSVPATAFSLPDIAFLPSKDTDKDKAASVPSWTAETDPSLQTPLRIETYFSVQVLRLFKGLDLGMRFSNLLNRMHYDANALLLYPQKRFDMMLWVRTRL